MLSDGITHATSDNTTTDETMTWGHVLPGGCCLTGSRMLQATTQRQMIHIVDNINNEEQNVINTILIFHFCHLIFITY